MPPHRSSWCCRGDHGTPASLCEAIHPSATQLPAGMLPAGMLLAGMLPVGSGTTFVRVEYLAGKEAPA